MPTYEYECTKCGAITEVFQPITASARRRLKKADKPACRCNAPVSRRIGTGAGIIFKGSGFYKTDYRSEGYKKAAKADKDAVEGKATKDDGAKPSKEKTKKANTSAADVAPPAAKDD